MTLIRHELKQSRISLMVWTLSIGFLMAVCIFLFPEMKGEMDNVSDMFASMGNFSEAFGMDQVNFGTLTGFYAVECGNVLGLGGAFFASLTAVLVLAKEEKEHTAEFLLTHPVSRFSITAQKLAAVIVQIVFLNAVVLVLSFGAVAAIGEELPGKELLFLHLGFFLLQLELAAICFGISAWIRRGSVGIGLGIAVILYFLNIIANISESAEFLKYITPFAYADGADIVSNVALNTNFLIPGMIYGAIGIIIAFLKYTRKDIL